MSNEQSPPVRDVKAFKPGKRVSTFRRLNIDFAGTALEQALAEKERLEEAQQTSEPEPPVATTPVLPYTDYDFSTAQKIQDRLPESGSLPESNSLSDSGSPPESGSLPESSSPPELPSLAHRGGGLSESGRLPDSDSLNEIFEAGINLMAGLPKARGHLKLQNQIIDHLYAQLDPAEQAIHLQLYRLSWGYGKPTCLIGLPKLAARAGMGRTTAAEAVKKLIKKGLIRKLAARFGKNLEQGVEYWVRPPHSLPDSDGLNEKIISLSESGSLPDSGPIKENNKILKDTHTKEPVGVWGSKFSLDECRRYADHLKQSGEGITNPGGYAKTIYRTGESDAQIEAWLPSEKPVPLDIAECPDCQGVGFIYPNGIEGGVVKCRHPRLQGGDVGR